MRQPEARSELEFHVKRQAPHAMSPDRSGPSLSPLDAPRGVGYSTGGAATLVVGVLERFRTPLAAVVATGAALLETTVGPHVAVGGGGPHLVLVLGVVWTVAAGVESGLAWAFAGGLALDVLAQRPLGSSAFALLRTVRRACRTRSPVTLRTCPRRSVIGKSPNDNRRSPRGHWPIAQRSVWHHGGSSETGHSNCSDG